MDPAAIELLLNEVREGKTDVPGALKNNFILEPTSASRTDQGDGRVDFRLSDANQLFARYSQSGGTSFGVPKMPGMACGCGYSSQYRFNYANGASVGWTHIFTPTTMNEFRVGFNWNFTHVGVASRRIHCAACEPGDSRRGERSRSRGTGCDVALRVCDSRASDVHADLR